MKRLRVANTVHFVRSTVVTEQRLSWPVDSSTDRRIKKVVGGQNFLFSLHPNCSLVVELAECSVNPSHSVRTCLFILDGWTEASFGLCWPDRVTCCTNPYSRCTARSFHSSNSTSGPSDIPPVLHSTAFDRELCERRQYGSGRVGLVSGGIKPLCTCSPPSRHFRCHWLLPVSRCRAHADHCDKVDTTQSRASCK